MIQQKLINILTHIMDYSIIIYVTSHNYYYYYYYYYYYITITIMIDGL